MRYLNVSLLSTMLLAAGFATNAAAAPKKPTPGLMATSSSSGGKKGSQRDFLVSMPVVAETPQGRLHLEYNIANTAGLAIEAAAIGETEQLGQKEVEENGHSMKVKGAQGALLFSRYSDETRLGGFFWTLGAGYREYTAEWKKHGEDKDTALRLETMDQDGFLHHRIRGRGTFGVGRIGYRYVAADWPFSIGGHLGLKHLNSSVTDIEVDESEEKELSLSYSPTTPAEKKSVRNQMMTSLDVTLIELGLIF